MIQDEPGASLACEKGPHPLKKDAQAETGCGQELQVNEGPNQPGPQPARLDFSTLQYRETLAYHRHIALVEVAERSRLSAAGYAVVNESSSITSLLHGHLRHAGKRFAVLLECRGIANHKDLGISGYSQIFLNAHSPGAVCLHLQPLARRRRRHPGGPDHGLACDALTRDHYAVRVDL